MLASASSRIEFRFSLSFTHPPGPCGIDAWVNTQLGAPVAPARGTSASAVLSGSATGGSRGGCEDLGRKRRLEHPFGEQPGAVDLLVTIPVDDLVTSPG